MTAVTHSTIQIEETAAGAAALQFLRSAGDPFDKTQGRLRNAARAADANCETMRLLAIPDVDLWFAYPSIGHGLRQGLAVD